MKIIRSFKIRGFILAAAFSAALGFATSASAQVSYLVDLNSKTVTVIGNVVAYGINDAGQVVGLSGTAGVDSHAFITGSDGMGMRDISTLGGALTALLIINGAGQVAGESVTVGDAAVHGFITGPNALGERR